MREIYLKDQRLEKILSRLTDSVYEPETLKKIIADHHKGIIDCKMIPQYHGASDEYFRAALKMDMRKFGFPSCRLGTSTMPEVSIDSKFFQEKTKKHVRRIHSHLGLQRSALIMLYPEKGFIGWHHNGNAPGYNILFSYSLDGDGYFSWYNKETDEIVKMQDKPGWNVKVGYYPHQGTEPDRVYWHTAYTNSPRLSVAFVVDDRNLWESMIEQVTIGDYDKEFITAQGPLKHLS